MTTRSRPHQNSSIETLERLFDECDDELHVLLAIEAELAHRSTERASRLRARVKSALEALGPKIEIEPSSPDTRTKDDDPEARRLGALYETVREKLLDLTLRNRMLNYSFGARSKRQLQIIDEIPNEVFVSLAGSEALN